MKSQSQTRLERLQPGQARHLERLGGELTVLSGRIWLTRDGATGDHFLEAGDTLRIGPDEYAVVESAFRGDGATLRWTPRRQTIAGRIVSEPLQVLAVLTRGIARVVTALADAVTAASRRAQGCIGTPMADASRTPGS